MRKLTPYDTGQRLEPKVWPTLRRHDHDDYGKVDFDNDESATVITLHLDLDDLERDDGYYYTVVTGEPPPAQPVLLLYNEDDEVCGIEVRITDRVTVKVPIDNDNFRDMADMLAKQAGLIEED